MNNNRNQGFSLIEIVVALGIISIALVAILGLVSSSLNRAKDSKDDNAMALMIQTVNAQLRSAGYTSVLANANYLDTTSHPSDYPDFFFDASGNLIRDSSGNPVTDFSNLAGTVPLYSCTVKVKDPTPTATKTFSVTLPNGPASGLIFIQLDFAWPYMNPGLAAAQLANQQHKIVFTSLAKYD